MVSSWRISHLGMKPVSGGRPPRESRIRGARAVRAGAFAQEAASMLIVAELLSLKIRKAEVVITRYVRRARRVRDRENCKMSVIQPRWATEE